MQKKMLIVVFAVALLVTAALPLWAEPPVGSGFAGGFISLDDFGASNATAIPGIAGGGDVLSGDINSNLQYRGITDRGWLGHNLDTPGEVCRGTNQLTGSLWSTVTPMTAEMPPAGALSAGHSKIKKDDGDVHLEMDIWAIVWDTQTEMGFRSDERGSVLSRSGVLELRYRLTNVGTRPVLGLKFYQYLHPHPNGSCFDVDSNGAPVAIGAGTPTHELSIIKGSYGTKLYKVEDPNFPDSQRFHFDLTFWAHAISNAIPGSTLGISAMEPPSMWGIGEVGSAPPTPLCADNPDLLWCQVETNNLPSPRVRMAEPGHIGGAIGWNLPSLNAGHSVERSVLLAVSDDMPVDP